MVEIVPGGHPEFEAVSEYHDNRSRSASRSNIEIILGERLGTEI